MPAWIESIPLDRVWAVALPAAAVSFAVSGVVVALSFLPGDPLVPDGLVFLLFFGVFPVHLGSVVTMVRFQDGRRWFRGGERALHRALSPWQRVATSVAFGACWLLVLLSFFQIDGQAERHDGRYYLSNHGDLTEVGRDEYIEQRKLQQRAFSAGPAGFYVVAIGAGLGYRRRQLLAPPPGPHPFDGSPPDPDVGSPSGPYPWGFPPGSSPALSPDPGE